MQSGITYDSLATVLDNTAGAADLLSGAQHCDAERRSIVACWSWGNDLNGRLRAVAVATSVVAHFWLSRLSIFLGKEGSECSEQEVMYKYVGCG